MKVTPSPPSQLKVPLALLVGKGIMLSRQAGELVPVVQVKASWNSTVSVRNQITDIDAAQGG